MNRILIYETDCREAVHLFQFLQTSGFAVATVTTARQAISFAREYEFELFLINLSSPGETGYTTVAEIKCRAQSSNVKVIGVVPQASMRTAAEEAGCDAVLVRPFNNESVLQKATELLERPRNSITYTTPMDSNPTPPETSFTTLADSLCRGVQWLEARQADLGDSGAIAIESMRDASSSLRLRLEPEKVTVGYELPDSVRDRQVRHDFRNLLAAVNGFAEILLLDEQPEDIQERLRSIKKESREFCNLLDGIRDTAA
ncbi:MAG: DNA-binding response OmpR family regulator [Verrucomicrobiales bacterium]|jgi:DNA-binding response OmpR family regulator